jgi:hypothetical protein
MRILVTSVPCSVPLTRVTIESTTCISNACDVETAHYLLFVHGLIKWVVRYISHIAPTVRYISEI